jgi:iron(III) transport system ATP-binding protein
MSKLRLQHISKSFRNTKVLDDVCFEMGEHEILGLLGESGSGKSTLLRIIAGFESPDSGQVVVDNEVLVGDECFVKPEKRDVGMIFQDYALFPHLSVEQNISFGVKSSQEKLRVNELIDLFELGDQLNKKPAQLSGGQQQRVAIARALAAKPRVLLLDEPFSNLDQSLRRKVRAEIKRVNTEFGIPLVMVSHDPEDALELADRIAVIQNGKLIQIDTPENLYNHPVNEYIGSLFGYISVWLDGRLLRPENLIKVDAVKDQSVSGVVNNVVFHSSGRYLIQLLGDNGQLYHFFDVSKLALNSEVVIGVK